MLSNREPALGALLAGCVRAARGPDRAQGAIALVLLGVWLVHAAVDWDWEVPVLTVPVLALAAATAVRGGLYSLKTSRHSR